MANNKAIQILRGSADAIRSSQELLEGQIVYNTTENTLTVGGGSGSNATRTNKAPIVCKELKGYLADISYSSTGDLVPNSNPNLEEYYRLRPTVSYASVDGVFTPQTSLSFTYKANGTEYEIKTPKAVSGIVALEDGSYPNLTAGTAEMLNKGTCSIQKSDTTSGLIIAGNGGSASSTGAQIEVGGYVSSTGPVGIKLKGNTSVSGSLNTSGSLSTSGGLNVSGGIVYDGGKRTLPTDPGQSYALNLWNTNSEKVMTQVAFPSSVYGNKSLLCFRDYGGQLTAYKTILAENDFSITNSEVTDSFLIPSVQALKNKLKLYRHNITIYNKASSTTSKLLCTFSYIDTSVQVATLSTLTDYISIGTTIGSSSSLKYLVPALPASGMQAQRNDTSHGSAYNNYRVIYGVDSYAGSSGSGQHLGIRLWFWNLPYQVMNTDFSWSYPSFSKTTGADGTITIAASNTTYAVRDLVTEIPLLP